jgi:hypothetical protein
VTNTQQSPEVWMESSPGIAESLKTFPDWLLEFTDDLIQSSSENDQDLALELLDLYTMYGEEVVGFIPQQAEPIDTINPHQLTLIGLALQMGHSDN